VSVNIQEISALSKFRIGLIGTGKIAEESHLKAVLSLQDVSVSALVDTDVSRAREVASTHKLDAKISSDIAEVLADIDAAVISTPNFTHASLALQCMNAGIHVLAEKPMTTTVEDAQAMCELAEEKQLVLAAGYFMRFLPTVEKVRRIIVNESFGKPVRFVYRFGTKGGWSPLSGYTLDRKAVGGGSMVVLGTHLLDLILYWFGYPDSTSLRDDSLGGPEAIAHATLKYSSSGITGEVLTSKTVSLREGCAIEFEQGILLFNSFGQSKILFRPFSDATSEYVINDREASGKPDLFRLQMEDFVNACIHGTQPRVPGSVGYDNVRILDELYAHRRALDENWYDIDQPVIKRSHIEEKA